MYPYIICTCGKSLGDIFEAFELLRCRKYVKYFEQTGKKVSPDNIPYTENVPIDLRDVFVFLDIDLPCCKARCMTQVRYESVY